MTTKKERNNEFWTTFNSGKYTHTQQIHYVNFYMVNQIKNKLLCILITTVTPFDALDNNLIFVCLFLAVFGIEELLEQTQQTL